MRPKVFWVLIILLACVVLTGCSWLQDEFFFYYSPADVEIINNLNVVPGP